MPAGKPFAPGRIPFHLPFDPGRGQFPERKISGILFARHHFDAAAGLDIHFVWPQPSVFGQFGRVKINAVGNDVGKPLFLKFFDQVKLLGDGVGRLDPDVGFLDTQQGQVFFESIGVELRHLPDCLLLALGAFFHLILARVLVAGQMTHVGYVHDMFDLVTVVAQHAFQNIFKNVGAQVANMGIPINRGPTGIDRYQILVDGTKFFNFSGKGVV